MLKIKSNVLITVKVYHEKRIVSIRFLKLANSLENITHFYLYELKYTKINSIKSPVCTK